MWNSSSTAVFWLPCSSSQLASSKSSLSDNCGGETLRRFVFRCVRLTEESASQESSTEADVDVLGPAGRALALPFSAVRPLRVVREADMDTAGIADPRDVDTDACFPSAVEVRAAVRRGRAMEDATEGASLPARVEEAALRLGRTAGVCAELVVEARATLRERVLAAGGALSRVWDRVTRLGSFSMSVHCNGSLPDGHSSAYSQNSPERGGSARYISPFGEGSSCMFVRSARKH